MFVIIRNFIEYFFNLPVFMKMDAKPMEKFLALAFAFVAMSIAIGPLQVIPRPIYYGLCGVCVLYIFLQGGITTNGSFFALYFAMGASALFCEWAVFKSVPRFGLFLMVTIVVSPFIVSDAALRLRAQIFKYLMIFTTIAVVISFFCYFLGINYMRSGWDGSEIDHTRAGNFGGLYIQSMLLGPSAMMAALVFFNAYQTKRDTLSIILFFLSAATALLSASRGAFLSLAVPVAYSIFMMSNTDGAKKRMIYLLVLVSLASIPFSNRFIEGIKQKQESNEAAGSTFSSRDKKWTCRMEEFAASPVWGVGFAAIDPEGGDDYQKLTGTIEPGSSHLAVLSMTGLIGFVPYLYILIFAFMAVKEEKDTPSRFARCLLIGYIIHAIVEGYALAGGSFLCLCYWMVLGQCMDYKKMEELGMINYEEEDDEVLFDEDDEYSPCEEFEKSEISHIK